MGGFLGACLTLPLGGKKAEFLNSINIEQRDLKGLAFLDTDLMLPWF